MTTDDAIENFKLELVGDSITVPDAFALAIRSFTSWPPDAWAVDIDHGKVETVYWLQGESIGWLTAHRERITGAMCPATSVRQVKLLAQVTGDDVRPGEAVRSISISFANGNDVSISPGAYDSHYLRDRANEFIDKLLRLIEGDSR
jgi:hypothetical protein